MAKRFKSALYTGVEMYPKFKNQTLKKFRWYTNWLYAQEYHWVIRIKNNLKMGVPHTLALYVTWKMSSFFCCIPNVKIYLYWPRIYDNSNVGDTGRCFITDSHLYTLPKKSNRKAMNRNWSNQKANPALKTKTGN